MKKQDFAILSALVAARLGIQWQQRSLPSRFSRAAAANFGKPTRCKSQYLPQPQHTDRVVQTFFTFLDRNFSRL
jgi:hypothetical protein